MANKITEEMRESFSNAWLVENLSAEQMSQRFNVSKSTIKAHVKSWGLHKTEEQRLARIKQTMIERYGVEHALQNDEFLNKAINTYTKKTGYSSPSQNPDSVRRKKQTNLDRYGVENPMQNEDVREKAYQTNVEKYGCKIATQNKGVRKKAEQTYFNKTGYKNPSNNPEVVAKRDHTFVEKFGINPTYRHLSEKTISILQSKDLFSNFIKQNPNDNTRSLANKLGCSQSTVCRCIHEYDLLGNVYTVVQSKPEDDLAKFIESMGVVVQRRVRTIIKPKELDIYCPEYNIAIEFNGYYWHAKTVLDAKGQNGKTYHFEKSKECENIGLRLIHIYENEWCDPIKQNIIKSVLRIAFGKVENKIYARNCEIRKITNCEAKTFNEANHLQGHRNAQITYGLFYNNKLVQLMSFSKHKKYEWEIIRGCPGSNNVVVGGVSKLFKHFVKEQNPQSVFSYCDFNKFDGIGYERLGMKFIGYTGPDMKWIVGDKVINRQPSKHKYFSEIADDQLYGAGSKKYLWVKES